MKSAECGDWSLSLCAPPKADLFWDANMDRNMPREAMEIKCVAGAKA